MPTITLRPTGDRSIVGFTPSVTGSACYLMINEAVADDDTTYISVVADSDTVAKTATSSFNTSSSLPQYVNITAVRLFVRWYGTIQNNGVATISAGVNGHLVNATTTPTAYTVQQFNLPVSVVNNGVTSLDITSTVKGSETVSKSTYYSTVKITQAYVEVDYVVSPPITGLSKTITTTTGTTFIWTGVTGASGYQLFKDGVLLTTITATTYTLSLTDDNEHIFSVRSVIGGFPSPEVSMSCKRIKTYSIETVAITAVSLLPNPVNINSALNIAVTAVDQSMVLIEEIMYSGEHYSGEI